MSRLDFDRSVDIFKRFYDTSKLWDFESKLYQYIFTLISNKTYTKHEIHFLTSYEQITIFPRHRHVTGL